MGGVCVDSSQSLYTRLVLCRLEMIVSDQECVQEYRYHTSRVNHVVDDLRYSRL